MNHSLITACNARFLPGALSLLGSAKRLHPEVKRYCMVSEEEYLNAKREIGDLAELLTPPRKIQGVPDKLQICIARLFMTQLPEDRVAYVDSDALFCHPAPELWQTQPSKISAVYDSSQNVLSCVPIIMKPEFEEQFPAILNFKGFNSGVLAMNPREWADLPERFEAALEEGRYRDYHPMFDQPLLNALIQPHVQWLPFEFNVNNLFDNRIPRDARIVHFTGGQAKPWERIFPKHEPQYFWWLKHGLHERSTAKLILARMRILLWTPKRVVGRRLRQWLGRDTKPFV